MEKNKLFKRFIFIALSVLITIFSGCGSDEITDPLIQIKIDMKNSDTYSIILEDMKQEGSFSPKYYHMYRIVEESKGKTTPWLRVNKQTYEKNVNYLGMSIFAKKDGKFVEGINPAGYQYVGDPKYGKWENRNGNSFWVFYGQYAMMRTLFGGWYRPVYFNDYNYYRNYRSSNRNSPYYGRNQQYGTNGRIAKTNKPSFFSRRKSSFSSKVSQRIGRSSSGFRGRSGGRGK